MKSEENWTEMVRIIAAAMPKHVGNYLSPIANGINYNQGKLLGTGVYWEYASKRYLITCEHISREQRPHPAPGLSHLPETGEKYVRLWNHISQPEPFDLGLFLNVESSPNAGAKCALSTSDFASTSQFTNGEVLFLAGFPGINSTSVIAELITPALPFCMREVPLPNDPRFSSDYHFAIAYPSFEVESVDGSKVPLPSPRGMSGSPVWVTYFVERGRPQAWTASESKVAGVAWLWDKTDSCLIVTKIEKVREFLLGALQEEKARANWTERGSPGIGPSGEDAAVAINVIPALV